jgi:methyl-accepting chemotaxis protein
LTKVQYENERLADPIMSMIGSIQYQDLVKRRLQAIVHCFDRISGSVSSSVESLSQVEQGPLDQLRTVVKANLDDMIKFTVAELESNRQPILEHNETADQPAVIEMF